MAQHRLDNLDKRILFELMADSRQPIRSLARKLHCSPQRAEYRISQLTKNGIITGFITVIDYPKVGLAYFVLNLALKNITGAKKEKILSRLRKDPEISLVLKGEGYWQVSVGFLCSELEGARRRIFQIASMFEPYIDYENHFLHMKAHHFPRIFFPTLLQTPWEEKEWVSGEVGSYRLSEDEAAILSCIAENARASTVEVARWTKLSEPTVRQKIKKMAQEGVIRGFTLNIDPNLTGHQFVRIYLRRNYKYVKESDPMLTYFRQNKSVFRVVNCIGKYDLICDVRMEDDAQMRTIARETRDKFSREIVSQELFRVYDIYKFNFFPSRKK